MKGKSRHKHKKARRMFLQTAAAGLTFVVLGAAVFAAVHFFRKGNRETPEELLVRYMGLIEQKDYGEMYRMTDSQNFAYTDQEAFIRRNSAIYEGIEAENIRIKILENDKGRRAVTYQMSLDTAAGSIHFENEMHFSDSEDGYKILWHDGLIFPGLESSDKVRIASVPAVRGKIFDRNGRMLAGSGTACSVGIVPGELDNQESAVRQLSELLDTDSATIMKQLGAAWVKENSFVPIKTIPKVSELDLMAIEPDEKVLQEKARQDALLAVPGVMIMDTEVRTYPFGPATGHLTGYVGNVTAEDLEEHEGEGYNENSVIGRSGLEGLFETELKGRDGCRIYIEGKDGSRKSVLANLPVEHGRDITLTIDARLQEILYRQFQEDPGCSVAMNPYTGEVLALVSTPSFDSNDFILGLSDAQWNALNEEERKPLLNRFRQAWCPGSTLKPVIAAVGLKTGMVDPQEDFGNVGLSWQKDASWGNFFVTTLHAYEPVTMENALIYSDNIYFAKAALKIGSRTLENSLKEMGFEEELPFEIVMSVSQYSNTEHIEGEIQLADSGYGQGQILINPLHLAGLYTAFCNEGNAVKPYLVRGNESSGGDEADGKESGGIVAGENLADEKAVGDNQPGENFVDETAVGKGLDVGKNSGAEFWLQGLFPADIAAQVLEGMKKVVNNPEGTGYTAHREDIVLAGKTGTAEIKASVADTEGTEIGWFAVFTAEKDVRTPLLIVSMVENVKEIGGSGYVVNKDKNVLEEYLGSGQ